MFLIDNKYKVHYDDIFNISSNYRVFHYDDVPILYVGSNSLNTKILGSFIKEDEDRDSFYFFHVLISNKQYTSFVNRKKTYREILNDSKAIFVLEKDINNNLLNAYCIPHSEIPSEYLPLENTLCPNTEIVVGHAYSFSLSGLIADMHEAFTNQVATVSKSGEKMLKTILDSIGIKEIGYNIHQIPYSEGSFRINFKLVPKNKQIQSSLLQHENELHDYINNFISYSINDLTKEAQQIGSKNIVDTQFQKNIEKKLVALYQSNASNSNSINHESLIEAAISVSQEFEIICDNLGKGFTEIEVMSLKSDGSVNHLGLVDEEFSVQNEITNLTIDKLINPSDEDPEYIEYEIQIYSLNTDKRKGNANIYNFLDNTRMDTPKISIEGDTELKGSIFTESMHLNKWIKVKAKANRSKEKFKSLKIQL